MLLVPLLLLITGLLLSLWPPWPSETSSESDPPVVWPAESGRSWCTPPAASDAAAADEGACGGGDGGVGGATVRSSSEDMTFLSRSSTRLMVVAAAAAARALAAAASAAASSVMGGLERSVAPSASWLSCLSLRCLDPLEERSSGCICKSLAILSFIMCSVICT